MHAHFVVATSTLLALSTASAQDRLAIDGTLGTTGIGINIQYKIHDRIAIRGGYSHLKYDVADENYDGVNYDVSLDMSTLSGFIDYHPFANGFVVSGGVYGGGNKTANLNAISLDDVKIGSMTVTPKQAGELNAEVTLNDMSPYLGIGWDSSLYSANRINFLIRAGAMFTGTPDVELTSTRGLLSNDAKFLEAIEEEEKNLETEIETFKHYPVLNIGMSVRF